MQLNPPEREPGARLCILSCAGFHAELQACVDAEGWPDVSCVALPARCGRPALTWDEIGTVIPEDCTQLVLLGRACHAGLGQPPAHFPPVRVLTQEQCFYLIAGPTQVDKAIADGSYLMSPAWLQDWRRHLEKMGFSADLASGFFQDFSKELLLLDTGLDPQSATHLQAMSAALGLPGKAIAVGLDHTRSFLRNLVLEWRLAEAEQSAHERQRQHAKALADHVTALDLLGQLTRQRQEAEVLSGIEDLFRMLFAPTVYRYFANAEAASPELPGEVRQWLQTMETSHVWTAAQSGFVLRLVRAQQCLGFIYVDAFQFPQFKEQYLNLALAMIDVCNLSLESVRTRKRLIEAEKMASLGCMIAGIAHEINTPVGVGVLAASTLQHQTRDITERFAQRSMTQSDLRNYFDASTAASDLIASSLERVGKLIASFRRLAVNGHRQTVQAISVAACLSDTLASFGNRLLKGQYQVEVNCPDTVIVQGYAGDLESVFTNLVANSLQHGFKGRTHGSIHIQVVQQENTVRMVYTDDGKGLTDEAGKRIFDPFFTTDMQSGMGLGMHLVYNLITQRMGGSISVDMTCSSGIRFLMEVPTQAV